MRLGIDIDNVIAVTQEKLIKMFNEFGISCSFEDWDAYDPWKSFNISERDTAKAIKTAIEKGLFRDVSVMPACRYVLKRYNFERFYITSRGEKNLPETLAWLKDSGLPFQKKQVHSVGKGSKFEKAVASRYHRKAYLANMLNINCFIEDEGETALEIANLGIPVILFNYPWNQHINHTNITRVGHWKDKASYWRETENILNNLAKKM